MLKQKLNFISYRLFRLHYSGGDVPRRVHRNEIGSRDAILLASPICNRQILSLIYFSLSRVLLTGNLLLYLIPNWICTAFFAILLGNPLIDQ